MKAIEDMTIAELKEQAKSAQKVEGDNAIVVLDRGWIFVGVVSTEGDVYTVRNCSNIRKWSKGGFGGLTLSAADSGAVLDRCGDIDFHKTAMIMCVPVSEDWCDE